LLPKHLLAVIGAINIDAPSITAIANGITAFSGMFTDIGLGITGSGGSTTEALEEIYGSTVDTIFNALNGTIEKIFDTNHGSIGGNITYIESFFQDGTFLDTQITDYLLDSYTSAFKSTMVCISMRLLYLSSAPLYVMT
jgi:hypothetical protein